MIIDAVVFIILAMIVLSIIAFALAGALILLALIAAPVALVSRWFGK